MTDLFSNEVISQLTKELKEVLNGVDKLKRQLKAKEQECEELKNELHKNFKEKDTLHLIIDRLLEASGYDTNTASAEEFEDVYEHMRYEQQQLDQLKAQLLDQEAETLKAGGIIHKLEKTLTETKEIAEFYNNSNMDNICYQDGIYEILQKISEVEDG